MPTVITRFSPSPTGRMHIGSLRTALYNYLYAKKHGGKFLLRIEDTDRLRFVADASENIFDTLQWADVRWDGRPLIQSKRLRVYQQAAEQLVAAGQAYRCFCPPERLAKLREKQETNKLPTRYDGQCRHLAAEERKDKMTAKMPAVVRFKMPSRGTVACPDLIRGAIQFNLATLDDQVLLKTDGYPTYHLASVVDDHATRVTHVIRGEEWLPSTPKHIQLYQAFGWDIPAFAHLPLLLHADRTKLSKRSGDVAVDDYRRAGYLPEALLNFVLLLGWNPGTNEEIFTREQMVERFSLERVNKSGAIFNVEKLNWMNGWYVRQKNDAELFQLAWPILLAAQLVTAKTDHGFVRKILKLEHQRIKRLGDLPAMVEYFFRAPAPDVKDIPWQNQDPRVAGKILRNLAKISQEIPESEFTAETLQTRVRQFIKENALSNGEVFWPMRYALSGKEASPGPMEISSVLGQTETIQRLLQAAEALERG